MLYRCVVVLVLLGILTAANSPQVRVGQPAGPLALSDQYEQPFQLSDLRGSVAVVIDGDRTGSQFNEVWGRAMRSRYKGSSEQHVAIVYVAHLASVPGFMRGFVRKQFLGRDSAHPAGRILLDWQGLIAVRFGFQADLSNAYVIDRHGILRYKGSGKGSMADLDPLFQLVDEVLTQ